LDWGQDLPGLKRYLDERGWQGRGHPPVYLAYFGTGHPPHYRIDAIPLFRFHEFLPDRYPVPLTGGVYCISATVLQAVYLHAPGPWIRSHEQLYQLLSELMRMYEQDPAGRPALLERAASLLGQFGIGTWGDVFDLYEHVRLARLCAYLRQREPDDQVGYSILIYRLTDADVDKALHGPPPFSRGRR
ncbi:MAG TPA: hypothetical protein VNK04_04450, partial [Gemmataceae bacterium]|nr:hypothetical protein [Gemmataceae bacterium]